MEIRLLQYFLAVAREENITRAAESLHLTQPTLSRQLTQLEEELGVELFVREKRRIGLTAQGVLFRRRAQEILDLVEKTEKEVAEKEEVVAGNIAIGCGELEAVQILLDVLTAFKQRYPQITFSLIAGDADQTDMRMEMGLLDIAIFLEPVDLGKYDYIRLGQTENWCIVMKPDDELAQKTAIGPEDLKDKPLIVPLREKANREVRSWLGKCFTEENVVVKSSLSTNATIAVYRGLGYLFCVEGSKPYLDPAFLCMKKLQPKLTATTVLAWKQHQPFSTTVTKFLSFAQEYLAKNNIDTAGK